MRQKFAALAAGAVLVAVPVACGNGGGGKSSIPKSASLVPADTIAYAEFVISPSVSQQRNRSWAPDRGRIHTASPPGE